MKNKKRMYEGVFNPEEYLHDFIKRRFPTLTVRHHYRNDMGGHAICHLNLKGGLFSLMLLVPNDAPAGARPLVSSVWYGGRCQWSYGDDHRPQVGWGTQERVHLHRDVGGWYLVRVRAGYPHDEILRVTSIVNRDIGAENEATMVDRIAHQWGFVAHVRPQVAA